MKKGTKQVNFLIIIPFSLLLLFMGSLLEFRWGFLRHKFSDEVNIPTVTVYNNPYVLVGYRVNRNNNVEIVLGKALDSVGRGLKSVNTKLTSVSDYYSVALSPSGKLIAFTIDQFNFGVYDVVEERFVYPSTKDIETVKQMGSGEESWIRGFYWETNGVLSIRMTRFYSEDSERIYRFTLTNNDKPSINFDTQINKNEKHSFERQYARQLPNDLYYLVNTLNLDKYKIIYGFYRNGM